MDFDISLHCVSLKSEAKETCFQLPTKEDVAPALEGSMSLQKLSCSEAGRHYRRFSMPDPIPLAQDLELLGSRYIGILQNAHEELEREDFLIFKPQQSTSYTPTGGPSS